MTRNVPCSTTDVIGRQSFGACVVDTEMTAKSLVGSNEGVTSAGETQQQLESETLENSPPAGGIPGIAIPESPAIGYMV